VQKAILAGRITPASVRRDDQGRFVALWVERARREWAANTDPQQALKNGKDWSGWMSPGVCSDEPPVRKSPQQLAEAGGGELVSPPLTADSAGGPSTTGTSATPGADPDSYQVHRAARERYQAELTRLELEERQGKLTPTADVERAAAQTARAVRDALLVIPDRVGAQVAAETDPARVHALLAAEVRHALVALSDALGAAP
jgi:hypothetical protein